MRILEPGGCTPAVAVFNSSMLTHPGRGAGLLAAALDGGELSTLGQGRCLGWLAGWCASRLMQVSHGLQP